MKAEKNKNINNTQPTDNKEISRDNLEILQQLIAKSPDNAELYFKRAELFFQMNDLGKAINDYRKTLEIEPEYKEAAVKIELITTILRYQNTDIYASPNTDMDPWLE